MSDLVALDVTDPLGSTLAEFIIGDPDLIYLDGNSLGRLHRNVVAAVEHATRQEWGNGLVRSWEHWIDLPRQAGDVIGSLIGASPGEVLVADQTSVNLFKLAEAAMARQHPRRVIVTDSANFPSDRYVLEEVARRHAGELRVVADQDELARVVDEST
ncbi:MAG: kynureninase, partial [Acidimicrobiia bacterium]|nr:kynureninase [Acidimicrobiia bacterium]